MSLAELWFLLIGVLWVGYFFLEGFDFGVGVVLPFLGRDDTDRRLLINSIGPTWDGNEVWLLVAGGATFAAFPEWYATLFSGFYLPLFLILVALIVRNLAFEYRSKGESERWKRNWDRAIFIGSLVPALLWGIAFANIVRGVKINEAHEYAGGFFDLLNPYTLVGGLTTLLLFVVHGLVFLVLKNEGDLQLRARRLAFLLAGPAAGTLTVFLSWTWLNARNADADRAAGILIALIAILCAVSVGWLIWSRRDGWAFVATGLAIALTTVLIFVTLFPNVMPSSLDPAFNLTIDNAASTSYTLRVMTVVATVFVPVVLAYQAWTYWVFRRRLVRPVKASS